MPRNLFTFDFPDRIHNFVAAFLRIYFADAAEIGGAAGVSPTSDDVYAANVNELEAAIAGTDEKDGPSATPEPKK